MVQITYSVTPFAKLLWLSLIKTKNKLVFNTCSKLRPESTDYSKVLPSSEILKKWFGSSYLKIIYKCIQCTITLFSRKYLYTVKGVYLLPTI